MILSELENVLRSGINGTDFTLPVREELNSIAIPNDLQFLDLHGVTLSEASLEVFNEKSIVIRGSRQLDMGSVTVTLEFFLINDSPQMTCTVKFLTGWNPSGLSSWLNHSLSLIQASFTLNDIIFVFASENSSPVPSDISKIAPQLASLDKGSHLFASLDINGGVFSTIQNFLGNLTPLYFFVPWTSNEFNGPIEALLPFELPSSGIVRFVNPKVKIGSDNFGIELQLQLAMQQDILLLSGGSSVHSDSNVSFEFLLIGVQKPGQTPSESSEWADPFGFNGFTIRKFGARIEAGNQGTELSISGEIMLGNEGDPDTIILAAGASFLIGQAPKALMASIREGSDSPEGFPLSRFVEYFTRLPVGNFVLLQQIRIRELSFYIVSDPEGFSPPTEPEKTYFGLAMKASVSLFGISCKAALEFQQNKGLKVEGELGIIELGEVLRITDHSGTRGPIFIVDTTQPNEATENNGYVYLSATVSLFGISQGVLIKALEDSFVCVLDFKVAGISDFQFACKLNSTESFEGRASFFFDFSSQTIEIRAYDQVVASLNLGFHVIADMAVSMNQQAFSLDLRAGLRLMGIPDISISLNYNRPIPSLTTLPEAVLDSIQKQAEEVFLTSFRDPKILLGLAANGTLQLAREAGDLIKNVYNKSFEEAAKLFLDVGLDLEQTTTAFVEVFKIDPAALGQKLKDIGYPIQKIATIWQKASNKTSDQMVHDILNLGFPFFEAATALRSLNVDPDFFGNVLGELDFTAEDIVSGLRIMNWPGNNDDAITLKLKQLERPALEIAEAFKNRLGLDEIEVGRKLKSADFKLEDIANALVRAWDIVPDNMWRILWQCQYDIPSISKGIQIAAIFDFHKRGIQDLDLSLTLNAVGKALKQYYNNMDDITIGIDSAFDVPRERLAVLFHEIGFPDDAIALQARLKWNWNAQHVFDIFTQHMEINPSVLGEILTKADFPDRNSISMGDAQRTLGDIISRGGDILGL
ncbi:hypothetical protein QP794_24415 [Paenibacillus sp. UMB7766-LJ446]|uniref:hypothetical protein n=1 Tax=Paenibacillus sp. UMB7766-LJ446 TaxID=3046313 RepID=UPI002550641F|nr:hypothetical protein [Paenibacillus sp. UMB7766-LJ446]MDK8193236.1 hypothetical protein [Paenibacillus sp. UMB7766-LJ446]